ncbi:hypothetical protein AUJ68_07190 [Candidatus Woesearchaeota archaeon CG1_02_57_44]|nr:MAG: hypothetical protein AUJ68_07190 [Candidatus Woesearchaeota archaeon CG1_02_57_44]
MLIPILLLIGSLVVIGVNYARTGELIAKDVSLKGGVTLTVFNAPDIDVDALEVELQQHFKADATVRGLREAGTQRGLIIDSGEIDPTALSDYIEDRMGITKDDYTLEMIGAALGSSFFKQALSAVIYAFLFMAIVVFAIFRSPMPSFYVVLAAVSDIVMTWATLILLGVKLSTAGIAGFLMLIGYSVDTDILLTTRVLKRKHISVFDATMGAMKTGLTMTLASMAAVIVALIVTTSDTLHQIMLILLIGLIADIINTWLQNAVLLRIYMKKTHKVD